MAKFTLTPDNYSCFFPLTHTKRSHSNSPFIKTSFQRFHFHFSPPKLTHRIIVRSSHQNVKENERVSKVIATDLEDEEEDVDKLSGKWPPWKNLPLRYKLIATTSLAFVICNMDKVFTFYKPKTQNCFDWFLSILMYLIELNLI